jgi:DUF1365 family protein
MMLQSHALCKGRVWHKRYGSKQHEFQYSLNMWLINLQELSTIKNYSWKINVSGFAFYKFINKRYLRDSNHYNDDDLLTRVQNKFIELGAKLQGNALFFFLGQLNNLGLYFSPLNLYLCYHGQKLQYILAEVSNTPWNERHYYLINLDELDNFMPKEFHVSPFLHMQLLYQWYFNISDEKISFGINIYNLNKKDIVFKAEYSGNVININDKVLAKEIIQAPINVYKIILGIYLEAVILFAKRIKFIPYKKFQNVQ